jgi:histidine triad (HIT) family protein
MVAGTAEASFVYRDDHVAAFLDVAPVTEGHIIVVPVEHLPSLADIPEQLGGQMFVVASRLAAALRRSGLPCEGVNLFLADGKAAFQDVFHAHLHVFARWAGDGFSIDSPAWSRPKPTRDELDATAAAIRAALG